MVQATSGGEGNVAREVRRPFLSYAHDVLTQHLSEQQNNLSRPRTATPRPPDRFACPTRQCDCGRYSRRAVDATSRAANPCRLQFPHHRARDRRTGTADICGPRSHTAYVVNVCDSPLPICDIYGSHPTVRSLSYSPRSICGFRSGPCNTPDSKFRVHRPCDGPSHSCICRSIGAGSRRVSAFRWLARAT